MTFSPGFDGSKRTLSGIVNHIAWFMFWIHEHLATALTKVVAESITSIPVDAVLALSAVLYMRVVGQNVMLEQFL